MAATFPRRKPRHLGLSVAFRTYYAVRRFLPRRIIGAALLDGAWVLNRIAREHAYYWIPEQLEQ